MALHCSTFSAHARREEAADFSSFRCYFSGLHVKKILRKYQQSALQPFSHRVWPSKKRLKRLKTLASSAPSENGLQCYDPTTREPNMEIDHTRRMLDASLDGTSMDMDMLQALHETARMFHAAIEKERSLTKGPWFAKAWLGVDHSAWIKSIAYQAAVHALIEAILDIARRQENRSSFVSSVVQKCLLRLRSPLEESIQQHLRARDPVAEAWLWNQQHPIAVSNLLSNLKEGSHFAAMDTVDPKAASQSSNKNIGSALYMLSLSTFASIMKLGTGKLSCPAFSRSLAEETGYLMDGLAEFSSIEQVYHFTLSIGLRNEFLKHFGGRAALHTSDSTTSKEERFFWVELIRESLRSSLAREGVRSKLASSTHFEGLDGSLVVFAFFTALGRRARSFLSSRRSVQIQDHLLGFFRYLEGGYVIFCPELATLATYQLFVEVACEDLEWLPFFDKDGLRGIEKLKTVKGEIEQPPSNEEAAEAIAVVLNVCSYWVDDFLLYSDRFHQTQNAEATKFLSNIQSIIFQCIAATSRQYRQSDLNKNLVTRSASEMEQFMKSLMKEDLIYRGFVEKAKSVYQTLDWGRLPKDSQSLGDILMDIDHQQLEEQLRAFDEDLHMVEKILFKLEGLLTGSDLSRLQNGNIHLTAINIKLQKIRRLKREAQALERSLQKKAFLKEQRLSLQHLKLQQGDREQESDACNAPSYRKKNIIDEKPQARLTMGDTTLNQDLAKDDSLKRDEAGILSVHNTSEKVLEVSSDRALVSEEVTQLGALQSELYQLDFRIREYAGDARSDDTDGANMSYGGKEATVEKYKAWDFLSKSTRKLKDASMDVLKGTQLLVTDIAIAITLLRSRISGHNLTEREKRILRRTCTDLASVIPIGILMLLPVTAVGHAAMLAAIQKYVPALIPSAYGSERLDLLKQLEQLREMDGCALANKRVPVEDSDK